MRQYRERSAETKRKISESLRNKSKSEEHKEAISKGLKKYWETIPYKNNEVKEIQDDFRNKTR